MNPQRRAVAACAIALVCCLSGCRSGNNDGVPENVQADGLDQLWEVYQLATNQKKQPPKQASDLNAFRRVAPGAVQKVTQGDIVVQWGTPPSAAGGPGRLLAYTKDAPTQGGYLLLSNGEIKKVSVDEFNAAKSGS